MNDHVLTFPARLSIILSYKKGYEEKKYGCGEHTESCRVMRGAWEAYAEYISELHGGRNGLKKQGAKRFGRAGHSGRS